MLNERSRLTPEHFERWVEIFRSIVDSMFEGPRADLAKTRAGFIADTLSQRLNPSINIKPPDFVSRDDVRTH